MSPTLSRRAVLAGTVLATLLGAAAVRAAPPPASPTLAARVANGHGPMAAAALDLRAMGPADATMDAEGVARPDPWFAALQAAKAQLPKSGFGAAAKSQIMAVGGAALQRMSAAPQQAGGGLIGVWDAFPYTGWLPASPQIAAGPDHLLATVNSRLRIFDKDGGLVASNSLRSWFAPVLTPLGIDGFFVTEPWALYDAPAKRFVLSAVASRGDGLSIFLLAVSHDEQPVGGWCVFGSDARLDGDMPTQTFANGPRIGINADSVILTANMFNATSGAFSYAKARFFPKSALYDNACPSTVRWSDVWDLKNADGSNVSDLRPVLGEGSGHDAWLVNGRFDQSAALSLWRVQTTAGAFPLGTPPRTPALSSVPVAPFSIAPDAEQPGVDTLVSTGSASLQSAVQRGLSLWTAHTVACTWLGDATLRACVRWYELGLNTGTVRQAGTFGESGHYLFDPAVLPDNGGNAVIAFNRAGKALPVEADYACRRSFAPPGVTDAQLVPMVAGQGCYVRLGGTDYNRWGLHNGISLDPVTGRTWIHTSYAYGSSTDCSANAWRTALAEVSCAAIAPPTGPTPVHLPTLQPIAPGAGAPTPRPTLAPACRTAVDVLLVLDSSGSIGGDNYETVRAFSRAFVAGLGVGASGAHVGIVQFSSPNENRLEIGLTGDLDKLNDAIRTMRWFGGSTDMDDGLQLGLDELQSHHRNGVPAVMVLMSDGQPNQGDPVPVATVAKAAGVRLITIGVGGGIDADLMRSMASAPPEANFFFAEEFDALMELLDRLVVDLCPPPATPAPEPTATPDLRLTHHVYFPILINDPACPPRNDFVDVALLIDASTSMLLPSTDGRPKYEVALAAAREFTRGMRLQPDGDQLAVLAFNAEAQLLQPLTSDRARIDAILRTFTPIRQSSQLELGVQRATKELTGSRHRNNHHQALIVLSDGRSNPNHGDLSIFAALDAKQRGIVVYVVGMGPDMDVGTLAPMASGQSRFYPADRDEQLAPIFNELVGAVSCPPSIYWPWRR